MAYTGQVTPVTAATDPGTGETTWTPGTPVTDTWFAWTMERDGLGRIVREYTCPWGKGLPPIGNTATPSVVTITRAGRYALASMKETQPSVTTD